MNDLEYIDMKILDAKYHQDKYSKMGNIEQSKYYLQLEKQLKSIRKKLLAWDTISKYIYIFTGIFNEYEYINISSLCEELTREDELIIIEGTKQ